VPTHSLTDSVTADAAREFVRLIEIMAALRAPDGCPWDREQTIDTLKKYVLEETYELLEAIDRHDHEALREELGDFLFEAVFVAQLEHEAGHFSIADSVRSIADKLVRRHPHVFARGEEEAPLETANQVRVRWEEVKAEERGGQAKPQTLLSGIPPALPALLRAYQIGARAHSVGFDWDRPGASAGKFPTLTEPYAGFHDMVFTEESTTAAFLLRARREGIRDFGACMAPMTAAAPHMSYFISSIASPGLIEMPPESNVMPLPTSTTGAGALLPEPAP